MIIDIKKGDILQAGVKNIIFAVNEEGINDSGFAGMISREYWPELSYHPSQLGSILRKEIAEYNFYALVCHSIQYGWRNAASYIEESINAIRVPDQEGMYYKPKELSSVFIGNGPVGKMQGADTLLILAAMARAYPRITIYTLEE